MDFHFGNNFFTGLKTFKTLALLKIILDRIFCYNKLLPLLILVEISIRKA